MAERQRLTEKLVRAAEPRVSDFQIFDEEVLGFSLVVYRSGNRAFAFSYRFQGRQRRYTIGRWPDWTVVAARERCKLLRRDIEAGVDPMAQRELAREAPRVSDLIDAYVETHVPRLAKRNGDDQRSMLRKLVEPHWRHKLVEEVTPADVEALLSIVAAGRSRPAKGEPKSPPKPTPVRANRCGEVLRKMFGLAVKWKMRPDNPATGFRKRIEVERERFLAFDELERIAEALGAAERRSEEDRTNVEAVRLLLLTGARVGEVFRARFEQFNLDYLAWVKPAATTKQRRTHRLPISEDAAALVRRRRAAVPEDCPWLFPGRADSKPIQDIRRFWRSIQKAAKVEYVQLRDLRHTFASLLASSGSVSLEMIGKLLGHSQWRTTQRYAHLMDSPLRTGVNTVADLVKPRLRVVGDD